jgi:hypothetical protein
MQAIEPLGHKPASVKQNNQQRSRNRDENHAIRIGSLLIEWLSCEQLITLPLKARDISRISV